MAVAVMVVVVEVAVVMVVAVIMAVVVAAAAVVAPRKGFKEKSEKSSPRREGRFPLGLPM